MIRILEELSEPSRRRLLTLLLDGPLSVNSLVESTGLKQPNVSNHLARLRTRQFVRASKVGRQVYYSLANREIEGLVRQVVAGQPPVAENPDLGPLVEPYAEAAARGDSARCEEILVGALRRSPSLLQAYQDLLGAGMTTVGRWYREGRIDEAGEHLASEITQRLMARTAEHFGHRRRNDLVALLGCAPGAWHVIGLRMIGDYLQQQGWRSIYLGPNVPIPAFAATVAQNAPHLVLLACHAEDEVEATLGLLRAVAALRSESAHPFLIGVGGAAVESDPGPFLRAGADFASRDLRSFADEALPAVERTVASWPDPSGGAQRSPATPDAEKLRVL